MPLPTGVAVKTAELPEHTEGVAVVALASGGVLGLSLGAV